LSKNSPISFQPGVGLYFGICSFHARAYADVDGGIGGQAVADDAQVDPVDIVRLHGVFVIACLVPYIGCNKQAAAEADGQTQDVDQGKDLVFPEVTQGDKEVVAEHGL